MIVFHDNLGDDLDAENISRNFIFPINSLLPLQSTTMMTRFNHPDENINHMEKLCFALNLTSTIAYSLGTFTPFSNIGNTIPMGIFYNNQSLITDFYKDIMLMYFKSGEQITWYLRYNKDQTSVNLTLQLEKVISKKAIDMLKESYEKAREAEKNL